MRQLQFLTWLVVAMIGMSGARAQNAAPSAADTGFGVVATPEPSTLTLLFTAVPGIYLYRRRRI